MQKKNKIIIALSLAVLLLVVWCAWLTYRIHQLQEAADINEWHTRELYQYE